MQNAEQMSQYAAEMEVYLRLNCMHEMAMRDDAGTAWQCITRLKKLIEKKHDIRFLCKLKHTETSWV